MSTIKQEKGVGNYFGSFASAFIDLLSFWSFKPDTSTKHKIPNSDEATASDWKNVGADLRYAQRQYAQQNPRLTNVKKAR